MNRSPAALGDDSTATTSRATVSAAPQTRIRLGLIGAGAVSRIFYAPLFVRGIDGVELSMVTDSASQALDRLDRLPDVTRRVTGGFEEVLSRCSGELDAIIVALPHHLHLPCVSQALSQGLHVFCEKPLGLNKTDTEIMSNAAKTAGRILAVCQPRRSYPAAVAIGQLLKTGWLGIVEQVIWEEGQPYSWPAESLSLVQRETGGEEVFDIGAHVFDLLSWWLGPLQLSSYQDDSRGGSGADFQIDLSSPAGAQVRVHLSRLDHLANQVTVVCLRGTIRWSVHNPTDVTIESPELGFSKPCRMTFGGECHDWPLAAFGDQLKRFAESLNGVGEPVATANDALEYARLFTACRQAQNSISPRITFSASGSLNVVTGAGGFIGCRLVERIHEQGETVRPLVRRAQTAVRLARLPVEIELCDIRRDEQIRHALRQADTVFHCAGSATSSRETIVDGTLNVLREAESAGVRRVIVFSSMLAYGDVPLTGAYDETRRGTVSRLEYGAAKREMEQRSLDFAKSSRVEVVILQPTCVFGPLAPDFVVGPLESMIAEEFFLMEHGTGRANLVHVDNLIDAAFVATKRPGINGRRYIVNEECSSMTWASYFGHLSEGVLGRRINEYPSLSLGDLRGIIRNRAKRRRFFSVLRGALVADPLAREWLAGSTAFQCWSTAKRLVRRAAGCETQVPSIQAGSTRSRPDRNSQLVSRLTSQPKLYFELPSAEFFSSQAVFKSDLIRQELGWSPAINRQDGLQATVNWARRSLSGRLEQLSAGS